ncbi:MAG: DUF131 domain-containing protein [Desulfurococcales archaeon]|nr:DUF131 domain-containing protein [Desulfurococcales archaeon]
MEGGVSQELVGLGLLLVFAGIVLLFLGVLFSASGSQGGAEAGGVIIIGPIPIVFGSSGRAAVLAAVLGAVLLVLSIAFYLLVSRAPPPH